MESNTMWQLLARDDQTCPGGAFLTRRPLSLRTRGALTRIVRRALSRPAAQSDVERYIRAMASDAGASVSISEIVDYLAGRLPHSTER